MISFDVTSLFTNVPLDRTFDIITTRIYDKEEITTQLSRSELVQLLTLCTKQVPFSFNDEIYIQQDGVAMGSPLGPVLANIFIVQLERETIPKLRDTVLGWNVMLMINAFDSKKQFTYELARDNTLTFLDTKIKWQHGHFETSVYRKDTNTDLYIHWESPAPHTWKRSTFRGLVYRAYTVCSEKRLIDQELEHLKTTFAGINGYPTKVVFSFAEKAFNQNSKRLSNQALLRLRRVSNSFSSFLKDVFL